MHAPHTEYLYELMDNQQTAEKLSAALSTYPLYKPKSDILMIPERSELNQRLLDAYKYREIGFETVGRFLDELRITMCEIMPYYNEMYKTVEIMANLENPFDNVDFTEVYKETRSGTTTNTATTSINDEGSSKVENDAQSSSTSKDNAQTNTTADNSSKSVHSGTPQSELSISAKNIDSVDYADDVTWNHSEDSGSEQSNRTTEAESGSKSTQETSSSNNSKTDSEGQQLTENTTEHSFTKKGNQGVNTYAHDMIEFRTSIIDVTNQIINDERISELFLRVF